MSYILDGLENATSLPDVVLAVNDASSKFLFHGILLTIFIVAFAWYKVNQGKIAFIGSLGVSNIFTIIFLLGNLIIIEVAWVVWIVTFFTVLFYIISEGGD